MLILKYIFFSKITTAKQRHCDVKMCLKGPRIKVYLQVLKKNFYKKKYK